MAFLLLLWSSPIRADDQRAGPSSLLVAGKDWALLGQGYQLTADSAVAKDGTVYFTDARHNRILKIDLNGGIAVWKNESGGAHGIASGPDGRLYSGQHDRKRIVALDPNGKETIVADGVQTHHLTITKRGAVYCADAPNHTIWLIDPAGSRRPATSDVNWPHVVLLSPDQSQVVVTDPHTTFVWSFRILRDGSLSHGQQFYHLEMRNGSTETDAGGMTFDTEGFLYVATNVGVQVFDRAGRLAAIIQPPPGSAGVSDVFFAGPNLQWLYLTDGDKIYRRPSKRSGATPWTAATPTQPR